MRARWLTLALLTLPLTGCFDMHGDPADDAGLAGTDGGAPMCELMPASVFNFACPGTVAPGLAPVVVVETAPSSCCESGTVRRHVETAGRRHSIELEWDACDCCPTCRCVGPLEDILVELPVLTELGTHTVEIGGGTCTFEVAEPIPSECAPVLGGVDFRAPEHLVAGQRYAATLTSEPGFGCGCEPRIPDNDSLGYSIELCDCCDGCECIDAGYQASHVRDPLGIAAHTVVFPHGVGRVEVHPREECSEITPVGLEIVGPRLDLVQGGQSLWWARATGEVSVCCVMAEPVVEQIDTTDGSIALRMSSCHREDCDCVPRPSPTETWFNLGELAPGRHQVRLGDRVETFVVP